MASAMTKKKNFRPDLQIPVEAWGTIKGATDKLTWLARIDACIAAGMVPRSFLHVAVRIATQWLNKETGLTWRSAENLASDIGMAKSSVEGLLEAAVAGGLLIIVKRGQRGRGKRSTIYRAALPDVLLPGGPGFEDALLPGGPGFKRSRKASRKSRFEQPANPGFGPKQIPAHRDDLPVEVIPEDIIPVAAQARGTNTVRVDPSNTTRAERESVLTPEQARAPEVARSQSPPDAHLDIFNRDQSNRDNPVTSIGRAADPDGFQATQRVRLEAVKRACPTMHVADDDETFKVFLAVMVGWSLPNITAALAELVREHGAGVPDLAQALVIIARRQEQRERQGRACRSDDDDGPPSIH
jgi:hypothetical protein